MKKLNYISMYLPFDLTVMLADHLPLKVSLATKLRNNEIAFASVVELEDYKPVLIRLQEATQEPMITMLGEWLKRCEGENFDSVESAKEWLTMAIEIDTASIPFKVWHKMVQEHVDMFGLIGDGLAIPKSYELV